jgi:hypothetical protein
VFLQHQCVDPFGQQTVRVSRRSVRTRLSDIKIFSCFNASQVERYEIQLAWYW